MVRLRQYLPPEPYVKQCRELTRLNRLAYAGETWLKDWHGFVYIPFYQRFFYLFREYHDEIPGNAYEILSEPTQWTDFRIAKHDLLNLINRKKRLAKRQALRLEEVAQ